MDGKPLHGRPPTGRLLPRQGRQRLIPGMEVIDAGFMQNSARHSTVVALDEPTRCPLMPKLPVLSDAVPLKASRPTTAVNCRKLPPLPCTLTSLSPEYPVKLAEEGIEVMATLSNSSIGSASVGHPRRLIPLKDLKKKDDLLAKGPKKTAQRSTELTKIDKKGKTQAKNILSPPALIASKQDDCTQKPQPPSKPRVRKSIGQRLRTKKTAELVSTALHNLNVELEADVFVKAPITIIAEDLGTVRHGINTTVTNCCGISDEAVATSGCGDSVATRMARANLQVGLPSENDSLTHQEIAVAPERVLETPQEMTAMVPRATSSSKLQEIWECRKRRKQTGKKVSAYRVSISPQLLLISEVDECSPLNSEASSPGQLEESTPVAIQPHPPAGPCSAVAHRPSRRSCKGVRRPRSQIHR